MTAKVRDKSENRICARAKLLMFLFSGANANTMAETKPTTGIAKRIISKKNAGVLKGFDDFSVAGVSTGRGAGAGARGAAHFMQKRLFSGFSVPHLRHLIKDI